MHRVDYVSGSFVLVICDFCLIVLKKESTRGVKIITEIRNGYKVISKYLLSFRKSITVQNICMRREMAALENFGRRQYGATDAEKSKSAKVNAECYVA